MEDENEEKKKQTLGFDFRAMSTADHADRNENEVKEKLPLDLVHEVLSWSNVNTLASHRLVCSEWQNIISMSHFVNLHLQRTETIRGFLLQGHYGGRRCFSFVTQMVLPKSFSLDFLPNRVKIEASTGDQTGHGLLCCTDPGGRRYYVCKPTTREWILLPSPSGQFSTIKMGIGIVNMCTPPVFKIVRLSVFENREVDTKTYYTELFDSVEWEWKTLQSLPGIDFSLLGPKNGTVVVVNKSFYWLSSHYACKRIPPLIVSFDLETNEWLQVGLPKTRFTEEAGSTSRLIFKLLNMSGDLALAIQNITIPSGSSQVEVWAMASKMNHIWMKKESFQTKNWALLLDFFAADVALTWTWRWKVSGQVRALLGYDFKKNISAEVGDVNFDIEDVHLFQSDNGEREIEDIHLFQSDNAIPLPNSSHPQICNSKGEQDLSSGERERDRDLAALRALSKQIWWSVCRGQDES